MRIRLPREEIVKGLVLMGWLAATVAGILMHEMWRDELQAIQIVKESTSFVDVFYKSRYEGHGPFWFIFLFLVSQVSNSLLAFQIAHLLIASGTVYLLLYRSPFDLLTRILLVFGYYFLFEYAIITRNYSVTALMLFLFASSYSGNKKKEFSYRITALVILFSVTAYSFIIACSALLYALVTERKRKRKIILITMCIPFMVLSAWKMIPPGDSGFAAEWYTGIDLQKAVHALEIIYEAVIPVPKFQLHFWGTNILDGSPWLTGIKLMLSVLIIVWTIRVLRTSWLRVFFLLSVTGIVLFTYVKLEGFIRHYGHIYLVLLSCLWIISYNHQLMKKHLLAFRTMLVIHVIAGVYAIAVDYRYSFSGSRHAAAFLNKDSTRSDLLVADTDFIGTPVSGYLESSFYFPQSDRFGTYMIFDKKRSELVNFDTVYARSMRLASPGQSVLFVLDYIPDSSAFPIDLIYKGEEPVVKDEQYFIYSADKR